MAALPLKNLSGKDGSVAIDGASVRVRGWKAKRAVGTYDDSSTEGSGWGSTAPALKTMEVTFTMDVPIAGLPGFDIGNIYDCIFRLKPTLGYSGAFLITDASPNVDIKGGVTLDCTANNVDEITTGAVAAP